MHVLIMLAGFAFCCLVFVTVRAIARRVTLELSRRMYGMTTLEFLRFDADLKARRLQMITPLPDDPSKRPGAGFGRGAVDRLPSELPADPSRYAVAFTMRGGPRDGETVDVVLAALVGAHLGRLTLPAADAYLHEGSLVRDQHVYEPSHDEPQVFDYVGTWREPADTVLSTTGIEGDR